MTRSTFFTATTLLLLAACDPAAADPLVCFDADPAHTGDGFRSTDTNGLVLNGLVLNGLNFNGTRLNGTDPNGLHLNGVGLSISYAGVELSELPAGPLADTLAASTGDFDDPMLRNFVAHLVSCTLAEGEILELAQEGREGEPLRFAGSMGVAPSWATGACDETCQQWVSSCVLSHVNARGESRLISMRGDQPAYAVSSWEAEAFTKPEATYFGNIFTTNVELSACTLPGSIGLDRPCGDEGTCVIENLGECEEVCEDAGPDGSWTNCEGVVTRYAPTTTVFRAHCAS